MQEFIYFGFVFVDFRGFFYFGFSVLWVVVKWEVLVIMFEGEKKGLWGFWEMLY